jgi:hypothetical protein
MLELTGGPSAVPDIDPRAQRSGICDQSTLKLGVGVPTSSLGFDGRGNDRVQRIKKYGLIVGAVVALSVIGSACTVSPSSGSGAPFHNSTVLTR